MRKRKTNFKRSKHIITLIVRTRNIFCKGFKENSLHKQKNIFLDLRKNLLRDAGVKEIAYALQRSTSLVHLDISSNELGIKSGSELFKALAVNQSLTSLNISSYHIQSKNRITEKGMKKIVPLLQINKILCILNLSGNRICVEGLKYIAMGIKGNNTLLSLNVSQNEIQGSDTCTEYLKGIVADSKLIEFDISDNPIGNKCFDGFAENISDSGVSLKRLYCLSIGITSMF